MKNRKFIICILALSMIITGCVSQKDMDAMEKRQAELEERIEILENSTTREVFDDSSYEQSEQNDVEEMVNTDLEYPSYVSNCDGPFRYQGEEFDKHLEKAREMPLNIDAPDFVSISMRGYDFASMSGKITIKLLITNHLPMTCDVSTLIENISVCQKGYCLKYVPNDKNRFEEFMPEMQIEYAFTFEVIDLEAPVLIYLGCLSPNGVYYVSEQVYDLQHN